MKEQELNAKFQVFEKQIFQLQEQLRSVEQALFDMSIIHSGLENLKGKTGEEIMAQIGQGIFVKANLSSEKIVVDIGGKNYVEKTIDETKEMIENQETKIKEIKKEIDQELERVNQEVTKTMQEFQLQNSK